MAVGLLKPHTIMTCDCVDYVAATHFTREGTFIVSSSVIKFSCLEDEC